MIFVFVKIATMFKLLVILFIINSLYIEIKYKFKKNSSDKVNGTKYAPSFSFRELQLITVLLLICDSYGVVFPKIYLLERVWSAGFWWPNIISLTFTKSFSENLQVVQRIWKFSRSILTIINYFYWFFVFFDISLLQRNQ